MLLEVFSKETRERIDLVRVYDYAQYTEQFNDVGAFEIDVPYIEKSLPSLVRGNFVLLDDGVLGMITSLKQEVGEKANVIVRGFLVKKILERRSFLKTTNYKDTITNVVRAMVNDLCITNSDQRRNIDFIKLSEDAQYIPSADQVTTQVTGDRLEDKIKELLHTIDYGHDLVPNIIKYNESSDKPTNIASLEFRVLKPQDRTIRNTLGNTPVVFSLELNNLANFIYESDESDYYNVAIVAGEGEGVARTLAEAGNTEASGLDRIEWYVDARDLQSELEDGTVLTTEQYNALLRQRGNERLQEHKVFTLCEGSIVEGDINYKYKEDFNIGDWVSIIDEQLNLQLDVQITEVTKISLQGGERIDVTFGYDRSTVRELLKKRGVL